MDFDQYSSKYRDHVKDSLAFTKADSDLILELKADLILENARLHFQGRDLRSLSVLDLGCGIGLMDELLKSVLPGIAGVDISSSSIENAKKKNPSLIYKSYDGECLPYEDQSQDLVFTVCVMHHIAPERRLHFLKDARRVLKKGGLLLVFEHNPWNPLTQVVVNRCEFDQDAVLLFPHQLRKLLKKAEFSSLEQRSILYFPWRGKWFRRTEKLLGHVPFGGQYYISCVVGENTNVYYKDGVQK